MNVNEDCNANIGISPFWNFFFLGGKTSAIMREAEDRNREENTRCKWIRYPASSPWKGIAA
jgi:hypothetical protein